jgi:phosphatidate phosphatase
MASAIRDVENPVEPASGQSSGIRRRATSLNSSMKTQASTCRVETVDRWSLRSVDWWAIIRRQDHAGLLLLVIFYVATGVIHFLATPTVNPFYLYDATISLPAKDGSFSATVPPWVAILIPLLMGIATLIFGELLYSRLEHHSLTDALSVILFFFLDDAQAVGLTLMTVEATKVAVGRYRPDFLARCEPVDTWLPPGYPALEYGNNTVGSYPCSSEYDQSTIDDGRQSFPSGHAAFSMVLGAYGAGYMIWCWHMRVEWNPRRKSAWREFVADFGNVCAKVWTILMLGFSWGVGCTRITDWQHNVSDVVAGWLLGLTVAAIYLLRATPRYKKVLTYVETEGEDGEEGAEGAEGEEAMAAQGDST